LNHFCFWREVYHGINSGAPDGDSCIAKQVHQEWNGLWTDPSDDFKSRELQVFIGTVDESSQQRQGTTRTLNQGGFSG
jgi:hypothetical protein